MKRHQDIKLKVCGMRDSQNIEQLYEIQPDYMGLIFWEPSSRYVKSTIPNPKDDSIKLVGVFVDEAIDTIIRKIQEYNLSGIQLHGKERPEFCRTLKTKTEELGHTVEVIKAFSVGESFDFTPLKEYLNHCDYFLFDTKGDLPGGTGKSFSWELLNHYPYDKPFFLSGGISEQHLEELNAFFKSDASNYCYAIDVNSKFELNSALKDIELLKRFKTTFYQS